MAKAKGKSLYPAPIVVAFFGGGEAVRMSFRQPAGKAWRWVEVRRAWRGSCFTDLDKARQNCQVSCAMTKLISQSTNVVANMSGIKRGSTQP